MLNPESVTLPAELRGIFPPYRWDQQKLWALSTPESIMATPDLQWLLDLTIWPTHPPDRIFDLAPSTVLQTPDLYPLRWKRIRGVSLAYPLELYRYNHRWVIIDGYHRLARLVVENQSRVRVRLHPPNTMNLIARAD